MFQIAVIKNRSDAFQEETASKWKTLILCSGVSTVFTDTISKVTSACSCSRRIRFSLFSLSRSTSAILTSSSNRKAADLPGHLVQRSSLEEQDALLCIKDGTSAKLTNYAGCTVPYSLGPPRAKGTGHLSRYSASGENYAHGEVSFGWFQLPTLYQHLPKCLIFTRA